MRILLLAPNDFYVDRGTPMDVDILLRALSARGHRVDAVVYRGGEQREYPGVTIHRARSPRWLGSVAPGFSLKKLLSDWWLFLEARRLLEGGEYTVVHAGEEAVFVAMWFRSTRGIPYVYDMDSSIAQQLVEAMPGLKLFSGLFNWCEAHALRRSIAAAPVCPSLGTLARERGAPHVVVLHDISQLTEPGRPSSGELRRRLGISGEILMYVGNFQPYQGIDLLLEAFTLAKREGARSELVLAGGTAAEIEVYRRKAIEMGVGSATHFIGPWPADRLGELLAEADMLVSPRVRGVNTPMKVFSYLHSGRALLATDLETHRQVLTPEIARLAPPNPRAFAEGILDLERQPALREQLGREAQKLVERSHVFASHQARVDDLYEYVGQATSSSPPPAIRHSS